MKPYVIYYRVQHSPLIIFLCQKTRSDNNWAYTENIYDAVSFTDDDGVFQDLIERYGSDMYLKADADELIIETVMGS